MPQAFISHSTKDNKIVLEAADYLKNSLIKTWIDTSQLSGGVSLIEKIISGIKQSQYFFAFISQDYLQSDWCLDELRKVYPLVQKHQAKIIPILLSTRQTLDLTTLTVDRKNFVEALLADTQYIEFNIYKKNESFAAMANALWQDEAIKIDPVQTRTIGGVELQEIQFTLLKKPLPTDFLNTWDFNIEDFIAENPQDKKPIRIGLPVAFYGIAVNWLITYLTIPFKNKRTVFVYNQNSNEYICVFSLQDGNFPGKVLK